MKVEVNLEPRIDPAAAQRLYQILFESHLRLEQRHEDDEEQEAGTDDQSR